MLYIFLNHTRTDVVVLRCSITEAGNAPCQSVATLDSDVRPHPIGLLFMAAKVRCFKSYYATMVPLIFDVDDQFRRATHNNASLSGKKDT